MHIRRIAAVVGVTALAGAFVSGPASADTAEAYIGSAAARGLNIKVVTPLTAGDDAIQATLGSAFARVSSDQTAKAQGIGQVLPDLASTNKLAEATAGQSVTKPKGCAQAQDLVDIVDLGIACGEAAASAVDGLPKASSKGSIVGLTVDGQVALANLDAVTTPIGGVLETALDTVCDTVTGAAAPAGETCDAVKTTVEDLVTSILDTRTLDVAVGESLADVTTEAGKVTSTASASGAVVRILPLPQVNGLPSTEPLATIEVGSAKASAVYDRAAGASTAAADPAIVRVKFNSVLTNALPADEIVIDPDDSAVQTVTAILKGTPLESDIIVSGTKIIDNPDGTKGAIADGVKLHLLKPLGESSPGALDGGITIELAHAEAGVAGTQAQVTPKLPVLDTPRTDGPAELPRTGGTPWIPAVGAVALGLAAVVRRASAKAAASR